MGFWTGVDSIIREADIVLVILDARMPELSRNERLEGLIDWYKKSTIFVFNKIDLVSKKSK
jgi:ribosome biogenesis GTPase A